VAGDNVYTMDDKGRVMIPVKYRAKLGEVVHIAKGVGEPCLYLYSDEAWEEQCKLIISKGSSRSGRKLQRYFIGDSATSAMDKQGRITIPQKQRDHASLIKYLAIADVGTHIEVWDADRWDEELEISPEEIDDIWQNFGL